MTLEEALSLVPTHWPLTPGVDVWQENDVHYFNGGCKWEPLIKGKFRIGSGLLGLIIDSGDIARRPIPQEVREIIAEMILHASRDTAKDSAWAEDVLGRWILAGKP